MKILDRARYYRSIFRLIWQVFVFRIKVFFRQLLE